VENTSVRLGSGILDLGIREGSRVASARRVNC
jgi:hypothetical protein